MRILVQSLYWAIFLRKSARRGDRYHTAEATLDVLRPVSKDRTLSATDLMSFGHLGAAI